MSCDEVTDSGMDRMLHRHLRNPVIVSKPSMLFEIPLKTLLSSTTFAAIWVNEVCTGRDDPDPLNKVMLLRTKVIVQPPTVSFKKLTKPVVTPTAAPL